MTRPSFLAPEPPAGLKHGDRPTFSVVIGAYQAAETIVEAVESALAQTEAPLEVVVCDDGSTDGTADALTPYRETIVYLRKENGGGASALNAAVAAARGEFVVILDADDRYAPERLQALAELAIERPDLDLLTTDSSFEVDGRIIGRFSRWTPFAAGDQRAAILDRCFIMWPAIRRRRLLEQGGFDESLRICYDWDCWIRLLLAGAAAGFVDEPLHFYKLGSHSLTTGRVATLRERVRVLEKAAGSKLLRPEERVALEASLTEKRRRALLAELELALRAGAPDARQRALGVAARTEFSLPTRLKAAAAAIAPGVAGSLLARREARIGRSRLMRPLPGE